LIFESSEIILIAESKNTESDVSELFSCIYLILAGEGFPLVS